ncbi:MAG: UDP-N-acetylmuramoyl-L-alanyl-D-glutamate--2,6-diaminopimelate ligase [Spirochaetales bacterium]|nr:UDP-N-acetylmuramoyl-L-alanyl-D-glutamate--2,6-diaminopimelate ligase [Spirochaetales bacterium]
MKKLQSLLKGVDIINRRGSTGINISGIAYDSRKVQPGSLFVAIAGFHTDGHRFISEAVKRGASAVVYSTPLPSLVSASSAQGFPAVNVPSADTQHKDRMPAADKSRAYIQVKDSRKALSRMASNFYGNPSKKLKVIGVTGTDGKSTTVWLIHQLLEKLDKKSGLISTVNFKTGNRLKKNAMRQSTPESLEIQSMLAEMVANSLEFAVVESTSHGLSECTARLYDVAYDAGVLTNVTHEHLEFHGTVEQYRYDKANLFRKSSLFNVVNADDSNYRYFKNVSSVPVYAYSIKRENTEIYACAIKTYLHYSEFTIHYGNERADVSLKIPGQFNVSNLLAAVLTVLKILRLMLADIASLIPELKGVAGRMEEVSRGQPFKVIVDYAHTPESFKLVLPELKKNTTGKLIAVFGSAGERDTEKRPLQGQIAAEYCDVIILADEDPRDEDREAILRDIAGGITEKFNFHNLYFIPDREEAIEKAFRIAGEGDTVALLGKGHEGSIIYDGYSIKWDEKVKAEEILKKTGLAGSE